LGSFLPYLHAPSGTSDPVCWICRKPATIIPDSDNHRLLVDCERCGKFHVGLLASKAYSREPAGPDEVYLLSGYTREMYEKDPDNLAVLTLDKVSDIISRCPRLIDERLEKLIASIRRRSTYLGKMVGLVRARDYPLGYGENAAALMSMVQALEGRGIIDVVSSTNTTDWVSVRADFYDAQQPNSQRHPVLAGAIGEAVMQGITSDESKPRSKDVFVVHGHDTGARSTVELFLTRLGLNPIVLTDQPGRSATVIEKFERYGSSVEFAVVILTGDDRGRAASAPVQEEQPRARQNVILELGYFIARLGRERVAALYEIGVDVPSDYRGVEYIEFVSSSSEWKGKLGKELKAAGYDVDMNRIF
jgi:predicted nucleotide-binding protein